MSDSPYRLTEIRIENVRCLETVCIGLTENGKPRTWAVIFGDNGVGKTTLLRSIALGLCDESSAAGLLREIYGDWNRRIGDEWLPADIRLKLSDGENELDIHTKVLQQGSVYSRISQEALINGSAENFPWEDIFACGYGAARRMFATRDYSEYATIDAIYTLFNYDLSLQNPELVLRRISDESRAGESSPSATSAELENLLDSIAEILLLPPGSISLASSGLLVSGPWGDFQPMGGLGDGYQATLSWVTDFLSWAMLYDGAKSLKDVSGIVLVDEIEQHLHPRWQRQIIKLLSRQFPNVQFIATTHTPMCAVGTSDLAEGECELIKLEQRESGVVAVENLPPPRGEGADQVLTGFLFDLPTTSDNATQGKIVRLNRLEAMAERSGSEEEEFQRLRHDLGSIFGAEETEFETTIMTEVNDALKRKSYERLSPEATRFQVLNVLRGL